jgi:ribonuclease J
MASTTQEDLVFLPLGGLGEIGMNAALYGFGPARKRQYILVDCGMSFAGEDELPGIDLVLPDISFIEEQRDRLAAIFITHAHEDHIGALVELWPRLRAPVYLTPFAKALLETRRLSEPGAPKVELREIVPGQRVKAGPFEVEYVPVAHSIPESNAVAIRTPLGLTVHTGDWKLDDTPVLGSTTAEASFRALGDEGVIALICDSTNVLREGRSPSERQVVETLAEIIRESPARVAITTFASNVARIRAVAEAAASCGREVVVIGRAMERVVAVARELGLLEGIPEFRGADVYGHLPRDKVVAVLTGSQGEPRAALARVASEEHPDISLASGDRVIFSSRTIPGNERGVGAIMNNLARRGIEVITDRHGLVHVSGHPRRDELALMYEWTRPQALIPAHGEPVHLNEHTRFARSKGIGRVVTAYNGNMVRLAPGEVQIIDDVPAGRLFKDGDVVIGANDKAVPERRKLAFGGIITVALALDRRGDLAGDPAIDAMGLPARGRRGEDMMDVIADAVSEVLRSLPAAKRRDSDLVENAVEKSIRAAVNQVWGKKPACHVLVVEV